ncbi:hypothetical protein ABZ621_36430 [Streptomyces sp. NPDC007863]|uniref:VMAP-C domain-containing protein n=1 Tax=Streptomyces sp. NPDC007863 TaxID=3154894 RepID=UPI0033DBEF39
MEFFLPLHLLNHPVEWFASGSGLTPPLARLLVVLRGLDRMRAPGTTGSGTTAGSGCSTSPTPSATGTPWAGATTMPSAGAAGSPPAKASPPSVSTSPVAGRGRQPRPPGTALRVGVPLAVWDRSPALSPDFRRRARKLLKGKAVELPQRAQELRSEAATAAARQRDVHPGRHLAVLFDDSNRLVDWSGAPRLAAGSARGGHDDEGETRAVSIIRSRAA